MLIRAATRKAWLAADAASALVLRMANAPVLTLYLPEGILDQAREGQHNFFNRVTAAVQSRGWSVRHRPDTPC